MAHKINIPKSQNSPYIVDFHEFLLNTMQFNFHKSRTARLQKLEVFSN